MDLQKIPVLGHVRSGFDSSKLPELLFHWRLSSTLLHYSLCCRQAFAQSFLARSEHLGLQQFGCLPEFVLLV